MNALIPLLQNPGILEKLGIKPPLAPYTEDWCSFLTFIFLYFGGNFFIFVFFIIKRDTLNIQE